MANGVYVLRPGEQYQAERHGRMYIITIQNVTVMASLDGENVTVRYDATPQGWIGEVIVTRS